HRPLAAALDSGVGRFAKHCEAAFEILGVLSGYSPKTVSRLFDLLVVIEHPGNVAPRINERRSSRKLDRDAALHVTGTAAPNDFLASAVVGSPRRQVASNRHGVQVASNDNSLRAVELGSGDNHIPVSQHIQLTIRLEGLLHAVGGLGF